MKKGVFIFAILIWMANCFNPKLIIPDDLMEETSYNRKFVFYKIRQSTLLPNKLYSFKICWLGNVHSI